MHKKRRVRKLFFTPGYRIEKNRIRDKHLGSYFGELRNNFWIKNTEDSLSIQCCGSRYVMENLDLGWKNADPGSGIKKFRSGIWNGKIHRSGTRNGKIQIRDPDWKNPDP
jgi:hypothetical protein